MPVSLPTFDDEIELYFRESSHDAVLDIGPGEGKYGKMLRRVRPEAKRIAVEIDPSYVEQFKLRELYDEVLVQDAAELINDRKRKFSAVIIGDCIEHMRKSAGVDLLHFLVYRSRIIIIKFPVQMLQDEWQGHASEAHVSVWSEHDFAPFDHVYASSDVMRLCIIRGYLNHAIEWLPAPVIQRFGHPSMKSFYDAVPGRWALADLDTLRRSQSTEELSKIIGPTDRFILADECQSGLLPETSARAIPFIEKDGVYWGMPADDAAAIAEVERQRQAGVSFIVFAYPALWALTHYQGLARHLRASCPCLLDNDRLAVFDLRPPRHQGKP